VVDGGYRSRAELLQPIVHAVAEDDQATEPQRVANAA
jgi:hypothetical protein